MVDRIIRNVKMATPDLRSINVDIKQAHTKIGGKVCTENQHELIQFHIQTLHRETA